jgi:hypothetical protein
VGCSGAKIVAKLAATTSIIFNIEKNQVIQGGLPPASRFCNVRSGIHFDAHSSHNFGTHFTLAATTINQKDPPLLVRTRHLRRRKLRWQDGRDHAGTDLGAMAAGRLTLFC